MVIEKAGPPVKTNRGNTSFLGSGFLVDNYKMGDIVVSFDYEIANESINFIQIRDNNLVKHFRL